VTGARAIGAAAIVLAAAASACNGSLYFDEVPRGDAGAATSRDGADAAAAHPCSTNAECVLAGLRCDLAGTRTCVECLGEIECALGQVHHCDLSLHRCVACTTASHCLANETCVAHVCVRTCTNENNAQCPATAGKCEENGVCAACEGDEPCPSGSRCLVAAGACVSCLGDWDCPSGHCDTATYRCVECTASTQCTPDKPHCDLAAGTCRAG
jgi:hypothetical protein